MRRISEREERKELLELRNFLENLEDVTDKETLFKMLDNKEEEILNKIRETEKREALEYGGKYDLSKIMIPVLYEDEKISMRRPNNEDKDSFFDVKWQYSLSKHTFEKEGYQESLWEEYISEESLYYSIIDKKNYHYIGYCGVKNLKKEVWEIAIELSGGYCHKGYGFLALKTYLERVAELSGRREFASRVDPDNIASQGLMEKIGFKPHGLAEFLLHSEEDKKMAEEEFLDQLDERYEELAKKFHVKPRRLLSHVLEYRIYM